MLTTHLLPYNNRKPSWLRSMTLREAAQKNLDLLQKWGMAAAFFDFWEVVVYRTGSEGTIIAVEAYCEKNKPDNWCFKVIEKPLDQASVNVIFIIREGAYMGLSLKKGERIDLKKVASKALIGLGWETNKYSGGFDFDLDASAFLLGKNGKVRKDEDMIFYGNTVGPNNCVVHTGDDRIGGSGGDDEQIIIDFKKIPEDVEKIAITVTIYEAGKRRQNFGQVSNAYVRLVMLEREDDVEGEEELRYNLVEDFSIETAVVFCELYRYNNGWRFNAIGSGYSGGLAALCKSFGIDADSEER